MQSVLQDDSGDVGTDRVTASSTIPGGPPNVQRLRALRRMKLIATGLLVLALVIFIVARVVGDGRGAWGYVQAGAEASMVGGLADWFAVTALFRYPLGLRIPHTAIIPTKKNQIGTGLAGFVHDYFLTSEIVAERVRAAEVPRRLGEWLADPDHARRVGEELSNAVSGLAGTLHDNELRDAVANFADRRLRELDAAPLLARLLDAVCDSGQHQKVLTSALKGLSRFLDENRGVLRKRVAEESPDWVPDWVDDRVFARGFTALQSFLTDVRLDSQHELRVAFDTQLRGLAERLRSDPEQIARIEQAKAELLDHPQVREWLSTLWLHGKKLLVDGAADPSSDLRRGVEGLVVHLGQVLRDDPDTSARVDAVLQRLAEHVVGQYGKDITDVIASTIERWDTAETSRRLELHVGRDLQFIRINGTVVGSLAGLLIYTLSQVF